MSSSVTNAEVAIVGAGAIGGYLAARLTLAGRTPTLCARSSFPELILESGGETHRGPARLATGAEAVAPADFVFLTTKAQDTAGAAPWLGALCRPHTLLVVVQNGIEHEARVAPYAKGASIAPALAYAGVERVAPGHLRHHSGSALTVPKGEAGARLAALFAGSGVAVIEEEDFLTATWLKLLGNVAANPITALTLRRVEVLAEPSVRGLVQSLLEEAVAVGRVCGANLPRDQVQKTLAELSGYNPQGGTSMLYDRLAERPLEHEYLTGAVLRAADRHGIAVPVNRAIFALVSALSDGLARKKA